MSLGNIREKRAHPLGGVRIPFGTAVGGLKISLGMGILALHIIFIAMEYLLKAALSIQNE